MREALRVRTIRGTYLVNSQLIASIVFDDMARFLKVRLIGIKGHRFPYEDLLELNELKEAYCYNDFDFGDEDCIYD